MIDWLVVEPYPLKNHGVQVTWDDEIPNIWKKIKIFETTSQLMTIPQYGNNRNNIQFLCRAYVL